MIVGPDWLRHCVAMSKRHGDALVTANARSFKKIRANKWQHPAVHKARHTDALKKVVVWESEQNPDCLGDAGPVDFGGHVWTLPRDALRHFFAEPQFTRASAEDIQLSHALRKHGIPTYCSGQDKATGLYALSSAYETMGKSSSWRKPFPQVSRELVFCQLMEAGFETVNCSNCDKATARQCVNEWTHALRQLPTWSDALQYPGLSTHRKGVRLNQPNSTQI